MGACGYETGWGDAGRSTTLSLVNDSHMAQNPNPNRLPASATRRQYTAEQDAQVQGMLGAMAVVNERDAPELVRLLEHKTQLEDLRQAAEMEADTEALLPAENARAPAADHHATAAEMGLQPPRTPEQVMLVCKGNKAAACPLNVLRLVQPADVVLKPYPHLVRNVTGCPVDCSAHPVATPPHFACCVRGGTMQIKEGVLPAWVYTMLDKAYPSDETVMRVSEKVCTPTRPSP